MIVEAGPEQVAAKRKIFAEALERTPRETIVATVSSAITIQEIVDDPADRGRCLCAHCINPPTVIRLIECAPSQDTLPSTMDRAVELFDTCGFRPVRMARELPGFVANRLQGAILREAYRLVAEGVIGVEGVDAVVTEGLGPRWALCGPFETADLNTAGGIRGPRRAYGGRLPGDGRRTRGTRRRLVRGSGRGRGA